MNIIELPVEILVQILKDINTIKIRRVCNLFYSIYESDVCHIKTNTQFELSKKLPIENIPARIIQNLAKDTDKFNNLIKQNFIKPETPRDQYRYQYIWPNSFYGEGNLSSIYPTAVSLPNMPWGKSKYNYYDPDIRTTAFTIKKYKLNPPSKFVDNYTTMRYPHCVFNDLIKNNCIEIIIKIFDIILDKGKYYKYCLRYCSFVNNLQIYMYLDKKKTIHIQSIGIVEHITDFIFHNNLDAVKYFTENYHIEILLLLNTAIKCHSHQILNKYFHQNLSVVKDNLYTLVKFSIEYENEYAFTKLIEDLNLLTKKSYNDLKIMNHICSLSRNSKKIHALFSRIYGELHNTMKKNVNEKILVDKYNKLKKLHEINYSKTYNRKSSIRMNKVYNTRKVH